MTTSNNGKQIEMMISDLLNLGESRLGFDGTLGDDEVEIKSTKALHKNGVDRNGSHVSTAGRFWIDNEAHRILRGESGWYIFVIHDSYSYPIEIAGIRIMRAKDVHEMITPGANTKIRFDRIFPYTKV